MCPAGVSIDTPAVPLERRKRRSIKSLTRMETPEVVFNIENLTDEQVREIRSRVEAISGVRVPPSRTNRIRVIVSDANAWLRVYRAVEAIIEQVA